MKKLFLFLIFTVCILSSYAQTLMESQYKNLQVLEKDLAQAETPSQKTDALISLYIHHSMHNEPLNNKASKEYQKQLEIYTHEINDPELIARALYYFIRPVAGEERKLRIDRLFEFSKLHNLDFWKAHAKIYEAAYYFDKLDQNKTTQSLNEAINISKGLNDTLGTKIYLEAGFRYAGMNNNLPALQIAFQANEKALKLRNITLVGLSNNLFAVVYGNIRNYNKTIGFRLKDLQVTRSLGRNHDVARKHALIAFDFFLSGQPVLGNYHVTEAFRLADSLKASKRLYNEISGLIATALTRSNNDEILADLLKNYRQHFFTFPGSEFGDNVTLGVAYAKIGNMDSARSLINNAKEYFSEENTRSNRRVYYYTLARLASYDKNWAAASEYWKKCLQIGLAQNILDFSLNYIDSLNEVLAKQNLYPEAFQYYKLGDSLQTELSRQQDKEDITKQEVAALEKEKEMQAIEKEKEKNQRHNLQYLGITFGVVALFILLLLMGIFKVSQRTIKILSFFSFLLFFEFIFLIFKKQIAVITHGEPWKDLVFMVLLAAVMVPLHHWGEKKVVEYLSTKKFSFFNTKSLRKTTSKKQLVS